MIIPEEEKKGREREYLILPHVMSCGREPFTLKAFFFFS